MKSSKEIKGGGKKISKICLQPWEREECQTITNFYKVASRNEISGVFFIREILKC